MASDNFTRANENPLGSPWASSSGWASLRVVSNQCANSAAGNSDAAMLYSTSTAKKSRVTYATGTFDGGPAMLDTSGNGYISTSYSGVHVELYKVTAGPNYTKISGDLTYTFTAGDVLELDVTDANDVVYYKNGVEVGRATDNTFRTGLKPAMFMFDGSLRFSAWSDGVTGATLSPTAIASAATYGSHTVSGSGQTISPTAISSAATFGSHSVVKDVASSGIPSAAVYGSQTVVKDGQTLTVTGIASAAVYGAHTLSQAGQSLLPTAIGTAAVYGSHTVADVNLSISPAGIASAAVYGAHLVATSGTQTVSPTGIGTAAAYGSQTVANAAPQVVSPTAIGSAVAYGSNTVGLVLETIIVPGIGTAGQVGRPTLIGGISPTEFYIGSSNVTIDDRVEEDRPIGSSNVQQPLGDLE